MKKIKIIIIFCLISMFGCKKEEHKEKLKIHVNETKEKHEPIIVNKTAAEISIKEGGKWVERKYENGTFKNVTSLKVPETHTDHSYFIRYEGPGWESKQVGYRLYLDWRNAIDIFGKTTDSLILDKVGQDGFDSYHEMNDWGMDILKVGKGLGIGSIGRYVNNEVLHFKEVDSTQVNIENDTLASSVKINYYGWKTNEEKINLKSTLSIKPDSRYTKHTIKPSDSIEGICTGIVKHGLELITKESENKQWGYIATYGEQTLVPDNLGMAVFYQKNDVDELIEWEFDYLLKFKPTKNEIAFYFLGAWEKEKNGITTKEVFLKYLDEKLHELNQNNKL